jgi:hypothetical protein
MGQDKTPNDFKKRTKIATITGVNPQNKTVNIKYLNQAGSQNDLAIPYSMVSSTWGILSMPQVGDTVTIDNSDGELPVLKSMVPKNSDYLPYLDPGELAMSCENGSYIHYKNRRKKAISDGSLLDYDATAGPNGANDIEYEPGGVVIRARSKQQQSNETPRWDNHSYISVFDNGNIAIQAMQSDKAKGLLHFDGATGHAWWHAGDGKVEQYIELDPIKDEIVILSNGDIHQHSVQDWKVTAYKDNVVNVGGILQWKAGVVIDTLSADFDQITPDSDLNPGDIRIDNSQSTNAGKFYLHTKGDNDILIDQGNLNITTTVGGVTITSAEDVSINTQNNLTMHDLEDITIPIPSKIGIGDLTTNLAIPQYSALNQAAMTAFENNLWVQRLNDLKALITAMISAQVPNSGAILAQLATLAHVSIPSGSSIVKIAQAAGDNVATGIG